MNTEETTDLLSIMGDVLRFCEREGAESEVYGTKKRETIVSLERNDIKLCTQQHITGIGIRTLIKNSLGFACCNSLDLHTAKETAAKAVRMSRKTPPLPFNTFAPPRPLPVVPGLYDPHIQDFDEEAAICAARTMLSTAREDPSISVDNGEFFVSAEEKAISTSCGIAASERRSRFSWHLVGMARKGGEVGPYEYQYGCTVRVKDLYVEETAKKLAESAVATLHLQKIESFSGDLILGPEAVSTMIGDPMAFAANAHNVHMKQSVLAGRLGEKIASDVVTIVDDSTLPGDYNSSAFDREGSPHQTVTILDKGILKSLMHHSMTASANLGWMADLAWVKSVLNELGVTVNAVLCSQTQVSDVEQAGCADADILLSHNAGHPVCRYMETNLDIPYILKDMPLPIGLHCTRRWIEALGEYFEKEREAEEIIERGEDFVIDTLRLRFLPIHWFHEHPTSIVGDFTLGIGLLDFITRELEMDPQLICMRKANNDAKPILESVVKELHISPKIVYDADIAAVQAALKEFMPESCFGSLVEKHLCRKTGTEVVYRLFNPVDRVDYFDYPCMGYNGLLKILEFTVSNWRSSATEGFR